MRIGNRLGDYVLVDKLGEGGFGEVWRHMVALVRTEPALGDGLIVHECAAATGYRKWVQRGGEVGNPYEAAGAAPCDAASDWEP